MVHQFVVMVCGPHRYDDCDSPCFNRVDAAVQAALYYHACLLVCGDARRGQDVARFVLRARKLLADHAVIACYDAAGNTLGDVQAALRAMRALIVDGTTAEVLLVTDDYHMRRLGVMFRGEMANLFARGQLRVRDFGLSGPPRAPTDAELDREEHGVCDYLAGRYGENPTGCRFGKPVPAAIVASTDASVEAPTLAGVDSLATAPTSL
jgi:hypothetical protein